MKNFTLLITFVLLIIFTTPITAQTFTQLEDGKDMQIDGVLVSYSVVKKKTKKGEDLYHLTATITSQESNHMKLFNTAKESMIEEPKNAIVYFQFTNATGKALSSTNAYFYPNKIHINVDYECDKCPPIKEDEDPYIHNSKSYIIGTEFPQGSTSSSIYNIRVIEGETPTVRVMVY
jgi:hypothetical protein